MGVDAVDLTEGFEQGYPVSFEKLGRLTPRALQELPHRDGEVFGWDRYYMFRSRRSGEPPLFWAPVAAHKKPVFDDDGNVVKMKEVPAQPPEWRYYKELEPDLKKHLGWVPKSDRGPAYEPGAKGGRGGGSDDPMDPTTSQFSTPVDVGVHGSTKVNSHDIRAADRAKRMPEPDWDRMDMPSLMKAYDMASKRIGGGEAQWRSIRDRIRMAILKKAAGV